LRIPRTPCRARLFCKVQLFDGRRASQGAHARQGRSDSQIQTSVVKLEASAACDRHTSRACKSSWCPRRARAPAHFKTTPALLPSSGVMNTKWSHSPEDAMLPCSHAVKLLLPAAYLPNLISRGHRIWHMYEKFRPSRRPRIRFAESKLPNTSCGLSLVDTVRAYKGRYSSARSGD
jgi:hypothetical protein